MKGQLSLTLVQRRILQFFRENSNAIETARGIATWLAAEPNLVQEALEGLVNRKWLAIHKTDVVTGYALTSNEHALVQIEQALEVC